ncbi:hypothetical protein DS031_08560 [Bacillus taeanensis]|uniref:DUF5658 domain-containing protein n=2 Tax=Bacillus taeanensis TaxID=273032 RepID=A0A366XU62_9BACI|nr:hypothetical protein DS031_08560 [Bacillus taeanensis]
MKKYIPRIISNNKFVFLLCILCLLDAVFTDIGLRKHLINEQNPLMEAFYQKDIKLFYIVKLGLPICLLLLLYKYQIRKIITNSILFVNILYTFIIFLHIRWFIFFL